MAHDGEMTLERLGRLLEAFGAREERWPDAERDAALALLARSPEARAQRQTAAALDGLLDRASTLEPSAMLAARVLTTAPRPRVVVPLRRRRAPVVAAIGLAAAATLAIWLVRRADAPGQLDPALTAQLDDYETPTDALLAATELDADEDAPVFGCDDPALGCDDAETPGTAAPAARAAGMKEGVA